MTTRPLAVVTGASSGIGYHLARQFALNGYDLVIAAEDGELAQATGELEALGAHVVCVRVDLTDPAGVEELAERVEDADRPVSALALNAGQAAGGEFVGGTPLEADLTIVDLNCRSTVHLAKLLLPQMVARREGRVLVSSSIAATAPGPYQVVYNASKSFTQAFALGLREELSDTGVTVTVLMPGPADTEIWERGDLTDTRLGASEHKDDPADVAEQAFEALMAGEERIVAASVATKAQGVVSRFVPDGVKAKVHSVLTEPGSAE